MKQYTIGKKAAVIVLHQLCMILMVTGVFATGYAFSPHYIKMKK